MISLSADQRNRLVFVLIVAGGILALLWVGLVLPLRTSVQAAEKTLEGEQAKHDLKQRSAARAEEIRLEFQQKSQLLAKLEADMSDPDVLGWAYDRQNKFGRSKRIDFGKPEGSLSGDPELPPPVPYGRAVCTFAGAGEYQDIGAFVAALENSSPFVRVKQLTISRAMPGAVSEGEKLGFRVEWTTLVRTNRPPTAAADANPTPPPAAGP